MALAFNDIYILGVERDIQRPCLVPRGETLLRLFRARSPPCTRFHQRTQCMLLAYTVVRTPMIMRAIMRQARRVLT